MENVEDIIRKRREQREAEENKAIEQQKLEGTPTKPSQMPEPIMQFFTYKHLPPALAGISQPFCGLAEAIVRELPRNAERSVALRKLLEAKDAAVRAFIQK